MSRLDWFTILIVSICLIALGFLVFRTVQLMSNDQPNSTRSELNEGNDRNEHQTAYENSGEAQSDNAVPAGTDDQDLDDDELPYDPQEVEAPEKEESTPVSSPEKTTAAAPKTTAPSTTATQPKPASSTAATTTPKGSVPTAYNSDGEFMVVAGSFSQRYNAESQVKMLKGLGYNNARVESFNGALATALVDRFDNYDRAKQLETELKGKGVDCFVKRKQ